VSLEGIPGFDDLVEITLIDQVLRETLTHDEHRLQGFACGERLQQLDFAFQACRAPPPEIPARMLAPCPARIFLRLGWMNAK
jgi:hypothetical protein